MPNLLTIYMLKCSALRTKAQEAKPWPQCTHSIIKEGSEKVWK